ncbi:MAG TPA: CDP-archaeol synthase [Thermoleophilaceae bacterium]|jgi:CDP-diglyceride synthetase
MSVLWVLVPVLGAPVLHAPVLTFDLLKGLKRPLDRGATVGGVRLFGDNKTWRGAIVMLTGVVAATVLLSLWPWYWHKLPDELQDAGPWLYGVLLGLGVVLGELPNSFLKRRLGIAPGTQRRGVRGLLLSVYDQGDFVLAIWVFLLPIWVMSVAQAAIAFVVVTVVHLVLNVVGYAVGARTAPI